MANNLIISYDLHSPGQDYEKVHDAIKSLGNWAKVHKSMWYVNSNYNSNDACTIVWRSMDSNDSLIVFDSTNNKAAWQNLNNEVGKYIQDKWYK